jgi:DNA-directed RNA polymerase subunit M/transcription elongation factor TFIIS
MKCEKCGNIMILVEITNGSWPSGKEHYSCDNCGHTKPKRQRKTKPHTIKDGTPGPKSLSDLFSF